MKVTKYPPFRLFGYIAVKNNIMPVVSIEHFKSRTVSHTPRVNMVPGLSRTTISVQKVPYMAMYHYLPVCVHYIHHHLVPGSPHPSYKTCPLIIRGIPMAIKPGHDNMEPPYCPEWKLPCPALLYRCPPPQLSAANSDAISGG